MKVFVTGGTGLLGGHIIAELLRQNHRVTALVRSREKAGRWLDPAVDLVEGTLEDCPKFEERLAGQEALIHAAACYGEYYRNGRAATLSEVNVRGTGALLEAAWRRGVRNIVFISSAAVLDSGESGEVDETSPYSAEAEPYFQSKVEAEKEVVRFLDLHPETRLVLLLPTVMLGPGDRGPTPNGNFILNFLKGEYKFILPGSNRFADVRDVAPAVIRALFSGESGERYLIGGRFYPYTEIFRTLAEVTGLESPEHVISPAKLMVIARVLTFLSAIRRKPSPLTPGIARRLQKNFRYNSEKAQKTLGVHYRPLNETLADTITWFKTNGYAR